MRCIWTLHEPFFPGTSIVNTALCLWSIITFIVSTNHDYYNFKMRKRTNLLVIIFYITVTMICILSRIFCQTVLAFLFLIPLSQDITASMVVWLSRFLYVLFLLFPSVFISHKLIRSVYSEENWQELNNFKIRKYVDLRENRQFLYDLKIIRKSDDGSIYTIKEKDRQRHILLSGVTGTGKTSSALLPAVASDLDRKAQNEDYIKKQLLVRMIEKGDIHPDQKLAEENFDTRYFHPDTKDAETFINNLVNKAPSAGLTVIAPNADFADAVYELAVSRGFKVNRIDPMPLNIATNEMKPGFKGFNPLYISPDLSESQKKLEIFRKSRMFSDVLQAIYEQSAKTDAYFTSLNRNLTSMLAILILTTYPWLHDGIQPDMTDIQNVINDFSCVTQYLYALAKIVHIGDSLQNENDITIDWLKAHNFGEYQFIVSQITYDLLGAGKVKMEDQARGLRIILNEFLTDPLIRRVLCSKDTVNINHILAKGEITVVNYGLELGMSIATGFGLFFCLSFNQAVLRRPGNESSRRLHFYYCDEFPVLLHKDMEQIFTLFRQYKVCFTCAFQTFSQFDRNEITAFLKKVVLSNVGHHIIYGNCSIEEMELYQKLAGKKLHFIEQETISETALSSINTSLSFSTRTTPEYADAIEGYQMRNKDFQEVTIFGLNHGDHVPPFEGKLSFLTKEQKTGKKRCQIDWSLYTSASKSEEAVFINTSETVSKETASFTHTIHTKEEAFDCHSDDIYEAGM